MGNNPNDFVAYENSVEKINHAASSDPAGFVRDTEKAFHGDLHRIAAQLAKEDPPCRLVMLAGPSSSGKTTTANLLAEAIRREGVGSVVLSLDDFYLGENNAPLLPSGQRDYESVKALNLPEIQHCLSDLIRQSRCEMPTFNFEIHMPFETRRRVELGERDIAVVEGIHALNPLLIQDLPALRVRRIYISVKQGIRAQGTELFGPNEVRLVRRIVRDHRFRGTAPERTLLMWANVMAGERKYVKPFRKNADFTINSLHEYEPCVLKRDAVELLHTVPKESPVAGYARKLLDGMEHFLPIDGDLVPKNSVLREFLGGGMDF